MYNIGMNQFRTILFDFDGTIMDTSEGIFNSFDYALESFGIELPGHEAYKKMVGPPLMYSFQTFYGFDEEKAKLAMKRYREYYTPKGVYQASVYPGVADMLRELKNRGYDICLATSKPERYARELLERDSLDGFFTLIAGSDINETRVKKSEIVRFVLDSLEIKEPGTCVMVGDRLYDAEGAALNGVPCVGVLWGFGSKEELVEAKCIATAADTDELLGLFPDISSQQVQPL